ncbi:lipoate--protein ligase [Pediococcus stilesii]|uniref:lipoate--protein ligase n=1 Tax=Pediococcus stilesii TaxID=331679 RepID=A0A5R9BXW7_9LACO|nr:lipoate--protein ligase [Pediococcus stilesii]TLQ05123.1 lipoate--protein ligase [Pediococcus stilesii]
MRYITYMGTDAYTNIATDTWLLNNLHEKEPVFSLWQNNNAVIVGQNQNTFGEVNQDFIDEHKIEVVRRVTGGGAVYHDLGNLNFTLFVPIESSANVDFKQFSEPVLEALHKLNIPAEATGRNDLVVNGKKISGVAQRYANGYLMHHGTLLFDSNVDTMVRSLNVADEKFISKAAKSVRSRVGMIKDAAPEGLTLQDFWDAVQYELTNHGKDSEIVLTPAQKQEIIRSAANQFSTWDWNYGKSPKFNFKNHAKYDGGIIEVQVQADAGIIQDINFTGDFLGLRDWREIKNQLVGLPFEVSAIQPVFERNEDGRYFGSITTEELIKLFEA